MYQLDKLLIALSVLLLVQQPQCCHSCWEVINVDGSRDSPYYRGVLTSENFPHALPLHSSCSYEFHIYYSRFEDTNALCFLFKEMELFTVVESSAEESIVELRSLKYADPPLLTYAGNGTLIEALDDTEEVLVSRPDNLLNGSLCFSIGQTKRQYFLKIINNAFLRNEHGRLTRFLAAYETINTKDPEQRPNHTWIDSPNALHRCLDGTFVNVSSRCNFINDCVQQPKGSSDFLVGLSSDESYEHARCNTSRSFGTNFALGQASAHSLQIGAAQLDCQMDHSRLFNSLADTRDCSLKLKLNSTSAQSKPMLRLAGMFGTAVLETATCYRFFWFSEGFSNVDAALTFAEPDGGRVLLRLPARWRLYTWSLAEIQTEAGFAGRSIDAFAIQSEQKNGSIGAHWLDDLSAEPAACGDSKYETRMPTVCSFEWSTCGWETNNLPMVTDLNITNEFGVVITDHTGSSVSNRAEPRVPQRMLRLTPGRNRHSSLISRRLLPYDSTWCFDIWFHGLGDENYSVKLDVNVELNSDFYSKNLFTVTAPNKKWSLLSGNIKASSSRQPNMKITLSAESRDTGLHAVLLDDLSLTADYCFRQAEINGTAECGRLEQLCANQRQCILHSQVCDGRFDCDDGSDEIGCYSGPSLSQAAIISLSVSAAALFLLLSGLTVFYCKRRGSTDGTTGWGADSSTARLAQSPAMQEDLPSYAEATEGLPKYEELQHF